METLKDEAVRRNQLTSDELYESLSDVAIKAAGGMDRNSRRKIGRHWYDANAARLRTIVCEQLKLKKASTAPMDEVDFVVVTAALLAEGHEDLKNTVQAVSAAILLVRSFGRRMCD